MVNGTWKYDGKNKEVVFEVDLLQNGRFSAPLQVMIDSSQENMILEPGKQTIKIKIDQKPSKIEFDPTTSLLAEINIKPR
ncbi:MAG TPA: hypothetical protein VF473_10760 [Cyclobacteriaceae bacterium]